MEKITGESSDDFAYSPSSSGTAEPAAASSTSSQ
jgi:hypothetical protein